MVLNSGPLRVPFDYNFHFFPTFTLMWAVFFRIFGIADWVSRLFAAVFSLGTIFVFYRLGEKHFGLRTAIISSVFWLATPMFIYFGKMPVHEIPLMFFVLLAVYFYFEKRFRLTFLFVILAELTTWPGFFLVPALTIHWVLTRRKYPKPAFIVNLWLVSFLLFGLHLTHDFLVTGSPFGGGLEEIFFLRVRGIALVPYLSTLARWAWTYYSFLLPLAGLWGILNLRGKLAGHQDIPVFLLIYALFYPVVFRDAASRHDYLLIYFWPFLCLASALVLERFFRKNTLVMALTAGAVILSMAGLRYKYIFALENSDLYRVSASFGMYIHGHSRPTDKIFIIKADPSVPWDGYFISYYANRNLRTGNSPADIIGHVDKIFTYLPGGVIKEEVLSTR